MQILSNEFVHHRLFFIVEMSQRNIVEIPSAIKIFIKHFFGCRHCSENFMKETDDMHQLDSNDKNAAMIYLWKSRQFSIFIDNFH